MIPVTLQTLTSVLNAQLRGDNVLIEQVTTDTRQIEAGSLFVALQGERFDGHDFAEKAVEAGASALLVNRLLDLDIPQLIVADTRLALGQLGAWVRQQVTAKVVALTGSSGKTSVKEMTASILRQCGQVLYTAGNFNNDIGVPLTLLRLTPEDDFAVIELGANHIGEIAYTSALTAPQSVLVNNLAAAHLEGFGSLAGVAQAKGEIYQSLPANGIAIINANSHDWEHWQHHITTQTVWRFSATETENVDLFATNILLGAAKTEFQLHTPLGSIAVMLPLPGRHNISNALAAAALAISVGASLTAIAQGLAELRPVLGRLFPIHLGANKLLLDDTYNANVGSMKAAVNVLSEMPGYRIFVTGDMAELGYTARECHRQVGEAARQAGIDKVLSVGELSQELVQASGCGEHFEHKTALVERLTELLSEHAVITVLIKGSRSAAMEQVVRAIQEKAVC